MRNNVACIMLVSLFFTSCVIDARKEEQAKLFELLDGETTGISFINQLEYDRDFNVFTYRNYYNGGGVAIGDINNDGLSDIYFTSNLGANKLYLNKGNFQFEDISKQAGIVLGPQE